MCSVLSRGQIPRWESVHPLGSQSRPLPACQLLLGIPAFQANADGFIYIISQIGGGYNAYERFEVMPKTWKSFRVRQYLNNQQEVQMYSYKLFELNYVSRPFLKLS